MRTVVVLPVDEILVFWKQIPGNKIYSSPAFLKLPSFQASKLPSLKPQASRTCAK